MTLDILKGDCDIRITSISTSDLQISGGGDAFSFDTTGPKIIIEANDEEFSPHWGTGVLAVDYLIALEY